MIEIHTEIANIELPNGLEISGMNSSSAAKRIAMTRVSGNPSSSTKGRNIPHQVPGYCRQLNQDLKSTTGLEISSGVMSSNNAIENW